MCITRIKSNSALQVSVVWRFGILCCQELFRAAGEVDGTGGKQGSDSRELLWKAIKINLHLRHPTTC